MEDAGGSATVQFLAYLPVLFIIAVVVVAVVLVAVHFLQMKR